MEVSTLVLGGLGENKAVPTGALVFSTLPWSAATKETLQLPSRSLSSPQMYLGSIVASGGTNHILSPLSFGFPAHGITGFSLSHWVFCRPYPCSVDAPRGWPSHLLLLSLSGLHCMISCHPHMTQFPSLLSHLYLLLLRGSPRQDVPLAPQTR